MKDSISLAKNDHQKNPFSVGPPLPIPFEQDFSVEQEYVEIGDIFRQTLVLCHAPHVDPPYPWQAQQGLLSLS